MSGQPRRATAEATLRTSNIQPGMLKVEVPPGAAITSMFDILRIASATESPSIEQETREEEAVDLPWQVVVHNDPVNLMSYVTMVFQKVFGFSREQAEKHMLEVHQEGRSVVWCGLRERAELYVQQLHGYLLLATLERTR